MDELKKHIPDIIFMKLLHANLDSVGSILIKSETELCDLTYLSYEELTLVIEEVTKIVLNGKIKTAYEMTSWKRLRTGCAPIDAITKGGIPANGIIEIVGPSGVGKTQFTLQLSLMVQLPPHLGGFSRGAIYICTEDIFPTKRLNQLVEASKYFLNFQDNIFLEHVADFEQLRRCLYVRLPRLLALQRIGLIVVDSIAGVFRSETPESYVNRSQDFTTVTTKLNELIEKFQLVVICTNQVTENPLSGKSECCLGRAWSNLITYRCVITRSFDKLRRFEIEFSPDLPSKSCFFHINNSGITS